MSALETGPLDDPDRAGRAPSRRRLTVVAAAPAPIRRTPFLAVLAVVLGIGLVGLLVLNTTLQNQAFAARTVNREASLLANQQAQLQSRVDELRAPQTLADKAATLGMRPNLHPAFVKLPEGTIVGNPQKVGSGALPPWLRSSAEDIAREKAARATAKKAAAAQATAEKAAAEKAAAKKAAAKKAAAKKAAAKKAAAKKAEAEKAAAAKKPNAKKTAKKTATSGGGN